jgi:hypothetical protein
MNIIKNLKKNISNIPGWSTTDKIVVFEVDDWGAVRTRSKEARDKMISAGVNLKKNRFDYYDSLAGAKDLEALFGVLSKHKDKNGNPAVFTAVGVVANPDFEKIKASGFTEYSYEGLTDTLKRYYPNEDVFSIWKQGIDAGIFHPEFHGREHLHPQLWLEVLRSGDKNVLTAFENESLGVKSDLLQKYKGGYLSAFDYKDEQNLREQEEVIKTGTELFEKLFGYKAQHFTSSGLLHNSKIDTYLKEYGIKYIDVAKMHIEPLGGGNYGKKTYKLGQKNALGQTYITRNSRFEPNDAGNADWVGNVIKDVEIAFRWNKPAVISSHRVNYVGHIDESNRKAGLEKLDALLSKILQRWPDTEFMSVTKLGNIIEGK